VLDEPTEGIQPSIIKDIGRVIRMLPTAATWRSCWWSSTTTSPQELADDYLVMERGEVIARGRARTWDHQPEWRQLGGNLVPGKRKTGRRPIQW
jgi:urea transport system ATP-binding protein